MKHDEMTCKRLILESLVEYEDGKVGEQRAGEG